MTLYALMEHRELVEGTVPSNVGVVLLPVGAGDGEIITCKLVMARVEVEGQQVGLTLLFDISAHFGVEHLLNIASTGEYFGAMRKEKVAARGDDFSQYLGKLVLSTVRRLGGVCRIAQTQKGGATVSDGEADTGVEDAVTDMAMPFHLNALPWAP